LLRDGTPFSIPTDDSAPLSLDIGADVREERVVLALAQLLPDDDRTVLKPGTPVPAAAAASTAGADGNALPMGTPLGEFELLEVIGEGGFGIVYLALDHSLQRHVAIKEYMLQTLAKRDQTTVGCAFRATRTASRPASTVSSTRTSCRPSLTIRRCARRTVSGGPMATPTW
jgi:hypothetical protein